MEHTPERLNRNRLIARLTEPARRSLSARMEVVSMPLGEVVYHADADMKYVYFPTSCVISLLHVMQDGSSAEIAMVGNEGMVGVIQILGGKSTNSHAVVQIAGEASRMDSGEFRDQFNRGGELQNIVLHYIQALMAMMTQTAACNHHHPPEQQLSRWMLMSMDRMTQNTMIMTRGLVANMLGLRGDGASDAISKLRKLGLLQYENGTFSKLDRVGLERHTCECYKVVKDEFSRLLPVNGLN